MDDKVTGTKQLRWQSISFHYPYNGMPSMYLAEEKVITIEDEVYTREVRAIQEMPKEVNGINVLDFLNALYKDVAK
jgi:hypothetical protein